MQTAFVLGVLTACNILLTCHSVGEASENCIDTDLNLFENNNHSNQCWLFIYKWNVHIFMYRYFITQLIIEFNYVGSLNYSPQHQFGSHNSFLSWCQGRGPISFYPVIHRAHRHRHLYCPPSHRPRTHVFTNPITWAFRLRKPSKRVCFLHYLLTAWVTDEKFAKKHISSDVTDSPYIERHQENDQSFFLTKIKVGTDYKNPVKSI